MKRNKVILLTLIALSFLITTALFLSNTSEDTPEVITIEGDYVFSSLKNHKTTQREERTTVTNQSPYFSFTLPSSWSTELHTEEDFEGLMASSKKDDCRLLLSVYEERENFIYLTEKIELFLDGKFTREDAKIIESGNYYGFATETYARFPIKGKVYLAEIFFEEEKGSCKEAYAKLLNSISFSQKDEE